MNSDQMGSREAMDFAASAAESASGGARGAGRQWASRHTKGRVGEPRLAEGQSRQRQPVGRRRGTRWVHIIPLGGVGEVGKNATVIETAHDSVLIDAGVKFPDEQQRGIDLVIPDVSYLRTRLYRLRGVLLTHGHEDHIGSLPYLLPQLAQSGQPPLPVYGSPLTLGLVRAKLVEHHALRFADLRVIEPGIRYQLSPHLAAEFVPVAHSIPDSCMVVLHTEAGVVILTGDYKLDPTPVSGPPTDLARLRVLGEQGVLVLLSDCVRIERAGRTPSEQVVVAAIDRHVAAARGRVILTTFASNVPRLHFAMQAAQRYGRRVAVVGRSMEQTLQVARELGYASVASEVLVTQEEANRLPPERVLLLTTGSQGEPTSALARIAAGTHPTIQLHMGDTVILSATPVPGNDETVARTIDNLFQRGAHVIYSAIDPDVHVSGHASREELREVLEILHPDFVAPIHGELRHQVLYSQLAAEVGYNERQILRAQLGDVLEFTAGGARRKARVPAGAVLVDGLTVGAVTHDVLRDRAHLASDGVIVATIVVDHETGALIADPEIVARGVVPLEQAREGDFAHEAARRVRQAFKRSYRGQIEYGEVMERVKETLSRLVWQRLRLRPLILPVITQL